jgi:hypothetical protein
VATVARGFGPYMENPIIERMFKHMVWAVIARRAGLEVFSAVCLYVGLRRGGINGNGNPYVVQDATVEDFAQRSMNVD